ncbi:acetolactate synthase large subunit [Mycobacterium sp. CBMA293]|uniref:acetolactate synthase large subunit n=3 Tax=Mycolicibacterium TaxID=1866885 RepID=UPI0012DD7A89|nr:MULTISPECIES: acetolactate synthase large subunit [unclassified Mycolicibacterium]MUL45014.1 acetolactate synthase large subunit [Mycolicibacterium sp. CBMA 360]MUL57875.1 acetolactate synthase large subunit [Mycolicibacterium sp. CBMA 335]MUL72676.1 acetolactate synthase large subunit [Mycolicibacterium sp. CBMA 311]MUL95609.1 acetolactate synthase large subunit [Mycolicibacterium sp. CBMA 230]MUM07305.1 acetolactate synthase large subunit [Mycolicibacterium sp. CBMA 213]
MNGAQALIRTLVDAGVDVCFGNPGTSEMHFVAALDSVPQMRGVLCLFEGVVTGAADGYARMADKPAATLLHLGPGLGNGVANLHNARRAYSPMVNVVGDHALGHKKYDAPLESDIEAMAGTVSGWVRRCERVTDIAKDAVAAIEAAQQGQVATLILPADVSWTEGAESAEAAAPADRAAFDYRAGVDPDEHGLLAASADVFGPGTVMLLGSAACRERALHAASRIAEATGTKVLIETFPARLERGAGLPNFERLAYLAEAAGFQLTGAENLVLAGARSPVSFFAYPGKASDLVPDGCRVHTVSGDVVAGLEELADAVAPDSGPVLSELKIPELLTDSAPLTTQNWVDVVAATLPDRAIVVDESNTSGFLLPQATMTAPRHDLLTLTGGAIGFGLPSAVGAAVACPDRPVLCLQADGSAMYTISALWTMAHEQLNVVTVILNNAAYAILRMELQRVGAEASGPKAAAMLDLSGPTMDFAALATSMGVPAAKATTTAELADLLRVGYATPGPYLIDAVVPPLL